MDEFGYLESQGPSARTPGKVFYTFGPCNHWIEAFPIQMKQYMIGSDDAMCPICCAVEKICCSLIGYAGITEKRLG